MSETPIVPPAPVSPWGPAIDPVTEPTAASAAAAPSAGLRGLAWNVVSTLLLAGWISWQMGWFAGLALVFGVFVHEFGHVLVINAAGSGPSHIRIIPFFGGAATMARPPDTELKGVVIAVAGPVFGLLATLPFFGLAAWTGDPAWQGAALVIAGFNLLNLAPAPPLDGSKAAGPVLAKIHPLLEKAALLAVGAFAVVWTLSRGSLLAPLFIGLSVFASLRVARLRPEARPLSWSEWGVGLAVYAGAVGLCAGTLVLALGGGQINPQFFSPGSFGVQR
jgi:Zn-dependent protease